MFSALRNPCCSPAQQFISHQHRHWQQVLQTDTFLTSTDTDNRCSKLTHFSPAQTLTTGAPNWCSQQFYTFLTSTDIDNKCSKLTHFSPAQTPTTGAHSSWIHFSSAWVLTIVAPNYCSVAARFAAWLNCTNISDIDMRQACELKITWKKNKTSLFFCVFSIDFSGFSHSLFSTV